MDSKFDVDGMEPVRKRPLMIELTQGKVAVVDAEDFEWLSKFKWHAHRRGHTYYARRALSGKTEFIHRSILAHHGYDLTVGEVDHINGDGLDNRKSNLQVISHAENIRKCRMPSTNKSGFRGVSWHERDRIWQAFIGIDKARKYLGSFRTKIDAALAYDEAAKSYFGKFAVLNFPDGRYRSLQSNQSAATA